MVLLFAPMQGYTEAAYRRWHFEHHDGVKEYYTPFARVERGRIREKEKRDLLPDRNRGVPTVPQVIVSNRDELAILCDSIQRMGWQRIDINMGCPFPMQTHAGRGSGILPHPDRIAQILEEVHSRPEVTFSVKMRLGLDDRMQCFELLPMLNDSDIKQITLHPRLGIQQYAGQVNMEVFGLFYESCSKPLVYNGDIRTLADIKRIQKNFPQLSAVMIGRGLIDNPALAAEWSKTTSACVR
ncbi:MAG: tRNA-dihydrouridine synthase family protein [Bacteroidales bacterium]|nr:tRNA-dihydrouridine synthase family protein [Bacteroidales bacterium]